MCAYALSRALLCQGPAEYSPRSCAPCGGSRLPSRANHMWVFPYALPARVVDQFSVGGDGGGGGGAVVHLGGVCVCFLCNSLS
eukprot:scaffold35355_cov101-Isochrysis_galbana.AAC.3